MKKVALVTGASAGIGEATVKTLLAAGYTVFAAARRQDRMRELERQGATLLPLDLTDDASIVAAAGRITLTQGRIDVLINNAGYGSYGAVEDVPMDEARRQFEVNVFGLARLCQLLTPLMRQQRSGKIVNVTSIGGKFGEPLGAWYHATNFAVEGLSDSLRMELARFGVDVIIVEPGAIRTEWGAIALESAIKYSGSTAYAEHAREKAALFSGAESGFGSEPSVVAEGILNAIQARRPKTRYGIGGGAPVILALTWLLPDRTLDRIFDFMSRQALKGQQAAKSQHARA
jgi:NAD(P)-dependent dehydrogenase (short-subunit alcohol dehydrogenase family)